MKALHEVLAVLAVAALVAGLVSIRDSRACLLFLILIAALLAIGVMVRP